MSKEFIKMQKLAGIITEGQYKEKVNEAETNLLTADGLHKFLHELRNLINDKKDALPMINNAISSIADKLTEGAGKTYGIERNYEPYDFGPYTYEEAEAKIIKLMADNPGNYSPRLYNQMRDELPAIERMNMPRIDKDGNLEDVDNTSFSKGDLGDY